ncbi:hypothetical protein [Fructilactobacillus florum]|uniref:hypothetical protein n=1 Tax=Fructilactobacillus florum TaxID=640331 RepID=UPI002093A6BC|nr:hypothetical protein [Fructilactobacillus florum]
MPKRTPDRGKNLNAPDYVLQPIGCQSLGSKPQKNQSSVVQSPAPAKLLKSQPTPLQSHGEDHEKKGRQHYQ